MMSRRLLPTALLVAIFAPGVSRAQPSQLGRPTASPPTAPTASPPTAPTDYDKMYEDIEIFRRILDHKLTPLYPAHAAPMTGIAGFNQIGTPGLTVNVMNPFVPHRSLEGIYLKGQGVVYTATLSSLQWSRKAEADRSAKEDLEFAMPHSESEWDRVRRQIRNEKEKPKKPEASKPPELSDVLLKVLKDNGYHFSQLGANESITLVLTLREPNPSVAERKAKESTENTEGATKENSSGRKSDEDAVRSKKMKDLGLLAELHLKQGRYHEAFTALKQVENHRKEILAKHGLSEADDPDQNWWASFYRKLALDFLGVGDVEQARRALDNSEEFAKRAKGIAENKDKPASAEKPKTELPVKLIVSVPQKVLEEARDEKLSLDYFRRQAKVETLRFGERSPRK